jgi:hypothetical protein
VRTARALAFAVGVAEALVGVGCHAKRERAAACSPVLIARFSPRDADAHEPSSIEQDGYARAMSLAIASMSLDEEKRIIELVDDATARLEARLLPLGSDLGSGDPLEELRQSLGVYGPRMTAARSFVSPSFRASDVTVRPAKSCANASPDLGEECLCAWEEDHARDAQAERARFLAWPIAYAAVLQLQDASSAEEFAKRLRRRSGDGRSNIALVLLPNDLALAPLPKTSRLGDAARRLSRALAANHLPAEPQLKTLVPAALSGPALPWLELPPTDVLVVPRLSALASLHSFVDEIENAAGPLLRRWIHRP